MASMSPITPVPRTDEYPDVNHPGVYQSGPSKFTLKHPKDHSGAAVPMTIQSSSIFEIFDHQASDQPEITDFFKGGYQGELETIA